MTRKTVNQLRIIAGQWRGRKIYFPDLPGLRPTTDRIRETVFNWLMHDIAGRVCLDLFAGSGALGLEALSRGANHVTFVDQHPKVIQHLQHTCQQLKATNASIIQADATKPIATLKSAFDIIFLDPPFQKNLLRQCSTWIENSKILASNTYIYIESETNFNFSTLPNNWLMQKQQQAGEVIFSLYQVENESTKKYGAL